MLALLQRYDLTIQETSLWWSMPFSTLHTDELVPTHEGDSDFQNKLATTSSSGCDLVHARHRLLASNSSVQSPITPFTFRVSFWDLVAATLCMQDNDFQQLCRASASSC